MNDKSSNYNNTINTVNDVIKVLNEIPSRFYSLTDHFFHDGAIIGGEGLKKLERRFMIEFSIQFERLFKNKGYYQKSEYDFEIPKKFMFSDNANISIRNTFEKLNSRFSRDVNMLKYFTTEPDFLVHAGQSVTNEESQKLIIEAKLNPNSNKGEIFKDIFHTFIYSNQYNFKCSIMLLVHINEKRWLNTFEEYIDKKYYQGELDNTKKIFVIFKASYEDKALAYNLFDLLSPPICPKCHKKMVKRIAKNGKNAGNIFWGCSLFPKCKETKSVN
ncbi:topoisomerase DNA-binding C4 zinc finger domain-containing protein [Providencia manganoxydans]|uniref:topoisomerase DNA-binding C4 zinc finger domain-containing protein n=1 Tax=Providencia manganoxydans TaxID=2923283 RepID=UPI0032DB068C